MPITDKKQYEGTDRSNHTRTGGLSNCWKNRTSWMTMGADALAGLSIFAFLVMVWILRDNGSADFADTVPGICIGVLAILLETLACCTSKKMSRSMRISHTSSAILVISAVSSSMTISWLDALDQKNDGCGQTRTYMAIINCFLLVIVFMTSIVHAMLDSELRIYQTRPTTNQSTDLHKAEPTTPPTSFEGVSNHSEVESSGDKSSVDESDSGDQTTAQSDENDLESFRIAAASPCPSVSSSCSIDCELPYYISHDPETEL